MSRVILVGGNGFIGKYCANILQKKGRDVIILGRTKNPNYIPTGCKYIACDYSDVCSLKKILTKGCDIIDFAYATIPKTSFDNPVYDLISNLPASVGLFHAALEYDVNRLVIISSGGTVYGNSVYAPINEMHPNAPISPYGLTKLTIDLYAQMFHKNFGLPVVIARPANAYGDEQRGGTGQGFIATAIQTIIAGKEINVFGRTGSIRDYIHVEDVAAGINAIYESGINGNIYNIGTGVGTSTLDILNLIQPLAQKNGIEVKTKFLEASKFDVDINILDSSKLMNVSSWTPYIKISDGVARTWYHNYSTVG